MKKIMILLFFTATSPTFVWPMQPIEEQADKLTDEMKQALEALQALHEDFLENPEKKFETAIYGAMDPIGRAVTTLKDLILKAPEKIRAIILRELEDFKTNYFIEEVKKTDLGFQSLVIGTTGFKNMLKAVSDLIKTTIIKDNKKYLNETISLLGSLAYFKTLVTSLKNASENKPLPLLQQMRAEFTALFEIAKEFESEINDFYKNLEDVLSVAIPEEELLLNYLFQAEQLFLMFNPFAPEEPLTVNLKEYVEEEDFQEIMQQIKNAVGIDQTPLEIFATQQLEELEAVRKSIADSVTAAKNGVILNVDQLKTQLAALGFSAFKRRGQMLKEKIMAALKILGIYDEQTVNLEDKDKLTTKFLGLEGDKKLTIDDFFIGKGLVQTFERALKTAYDIIAKPNENLEATSSEELELADYSEPAKKYLKLAYEFRPTMNLEEFKALQKSVEALPEETENFSFFRAFIEGQSYEIDEEQEFEEPYLDLALKQAINSITYLIDRMKDALKESYISDQKSLDIKTLKSDRLPKLEAEAVKKAILDEAEEDIASKDEFTFLKNLLDNFDFQGRIIELKDKIQAALMVFGLEDQDTAVFNDLQKQANFYNPSDYSYSKAVAKLLYELHVNAYNILTAAAEGQKKSPIAEISLDSVQPPTFFEELKSYARIAKQIKASSSWTDLNELLNELAALEGTLGANLPAFKAFVENLTYQNIQEPYLRKTLEDLIAAAPQPVDPQELLRELEISLMALEQIIKKGSLT